MEKGQKTEAKGRIGKGGGAVVDGAIIKNNCKVFLHLMLGPSLMIPFLMC